MTTQDAVEATRSVSEGIRIALAYASGCHVSPQKDTQFTDD